MKLIYTGLTENDIEGEVITDLNEFVKLESLGLCKIIKKKDGFYYLNGGTYPDIFISNCRYATISVEVIRSEIYKRRESIKNLAKKQDIENFLNERNIDYKIKYDNIEIYFLKRKTLTIKIKNFITKIKNTDFIITSAVFGPLIIQSIMKTIYNYLDNFLDHGLRKYYLPEISYNILLILKKEGGIGFFNIKLGNDNKFCISCNQTPYSSSDIDFDSVKLLILKWFIREI